MSDAGDGSQSDEESLDFDIMSLEEMPSLPLKDIFKVVNSEKEPSVVTLDALIPSGDLEIRVLQTMLHYLKPSVRTLSVRFNTLSVEAADYLIEWIKTNEFVETLYFMGTGDALDKKKDALGAAWKKNLNSHRKDNMGYTLIRTIEPYVEED
jgi:hypothetical protein